MQKAGVRVNWTGKRVLVTGATGFIGQHLVRRLAEVGAQVQAGSAPDEKPERIAGLPAGVQPLTFDLREAGAVRAAVLSSPPQTTPEIVFHLAAIGVTNPTVDPLNALAVNTRGMIHLMEALREQAVKRIVLLGTCHEYGAREANEGLDPFNAYAASKAAAWAFGRMYWRAYNLPVVTVRPFQVYGPEQPEHTLVPAAIGAALAGRDFSMTPGEQERDFIYVEDVVDGLLAAAVASSAKGQSLDLGTGQVHTIRQIVEHIWSMTKAQGRIKPGKLPYRPGEVMRLVADAERTTRLIGWRAQVELEEGLRRTIEWKHRQVHK
jgi:nucleoside-diphosphate-sugar epimerase